MKIRKIIILLLILSLSFLISINVKAIGKLKRFSLVNLVNEYEWNKEYLIVSHNDDKSYALSFNNNQLVPMEVTINNGLIEEDIDGINIIGSSILYLKSGDKVISIDDNYSLYLSDDLLAFSYYISDGKVAFYIEKDNNIYALSFNQMYSLDKVDSIYNAYLFEIYEFNCKHDNLKYYPKVKADCINYGVKTEYWYCDQCEKYFRDSKATSVITDLSDYIIEPLGHLYDEFNVCTRCFSHALAYKLIENVSEIKENHDTIIVSNVNNKSFVFSNNGVGIEVNVKDNMITLGNTEALIFRFEKCASNLYYIKSSLNYLLVSGTAFSFTTDKSVPFVIEKEVENTIISLNDGGNIHLLKEEDDYKFVYSNGDYEAIFYGISLYQAVDAGTINGDKIKYSSNNDYIRINKDELNSFINNSSVSFLEVSLSTGGIILNKDNVNIVLDGIIDDEVLISLKDISIDELTTHEQELIKDKEILKLIKLVIASGGLLYDDLLEESFLVNIRFYKDESIKSNELVIYGIGNEINNLAFTYQVDNEVLSFNSEGSSDFLISIVNNTVKPIPNDNNPNKNHLVLYIIFGSIFSVGIVTLIVLYNKTKVKEPKEAKDNNQKTKKKK